LGFLSTGGAGAVPSSPEGGIGLGAALGFGGAGAAAGVVSPTGGTGLGGVAATGGALAATGTFVAWFGAIEPRGAALAAGTSGAPAVSNGAAAVGAGTGDGAGKGAAVTGGAATCAAGGGISAGIGDCFCHAT
jgi:hypothetical protein